jgi:chorismate-pyruvate lyase
MKRRPGVLWVVLIAGTMRAACVHAQDWPNTFTARLEALALLQTLNAELLSHDSATATLERWCDTHHLATPARVTAQRVVNVDKPAGEEQHRALQVGPTEVVRYRRVRLLCGGLQLSEADNWYVPSRLTTEMNTLLDQTDLPFGKVIQPLHFRRHTLSAILLWMPLPAGWEVGRRSQPDDAARLAMPATVLQHRAVLLRADGLPVSEVIESYSSSVLAFDPPVPSGNMSNH